MRGKGGVDTWSLARPHSPCIFPGCLSGLESVGYASRYASLNYGIFRDELQERAYGRRTETEGYGE